MMGTSHAITGAAAWIAITATALPATGIHPLTATEVVAGTIICAGAALLPDADHPSSTIAHSLPGGSIAAGAISALAGGHRKGMHSLLAVLALFFLTPQLAKLTIDIDMWPHQLLFGLAIAIAACTAFALKSLRIVSSWASAWIFAAAVAIAVHFIPSVFEVLPLCLAIGYLTHIAGDMLTSGGVPLFWPLTLKPPKSISRNKLISMVWRPNGALALPILGDTGSWREWALATLAAIYVAWGILATLTADLAV